MDALVSRVGLPLKAFKVCPGPMPCAASRAVPRLLGLGVVPRVLWLVPGVLGVVPRVLWLVPGVLGVVPRVLWLVPGVLGVVPKVLRALGGRIGPGPGLWEGVRAPSTTPLPVSGPPRDTLPLWRGLWMGLFFA